MLQLEIAKPRRGDIIVEMLRLEIAKPRTGDIIVEMLQLENAKPRTGDIIVEMLRLEIAKPRRGDIIVEMLRLEIAKPRRGDIIVEMLQLENTKPRRGDIIKHPVHHHQNESRNEKIHTLISCLCCCLLVSAQQKPTWQRLPQGPYNVGFKTMQATGTQNESLRIGIWYPAGKGGRQMGLKDYIIESKETPAMADTAALSEFKHVLELPFLFHLPSIDEADFKKAVATPFFAYRDAPLQPGKFPLVVMYGAPQAYPETFEFLASHGFAVACISAQLADEQNDTLLYVKATAVLEELVHIMAAQPYIDTAMIAAIGHGGGIQPSFYLAMRTKAIKLLINIDGGVFGPRSKTTLSPDYHPSKLTIPMLHIVTQPTNAEDDTSQFNVLSNQRYRLLVNNAGVSHHDFSIFGRVVNGGLHKRGEGAPIAEEAFAVAHQLILYFLQHGSLSSNIVPAGLFTYRKFSKK